MFGDFDVIYRIGHEFLSGHYSAESLYPLPAAMLFALLALLSYPAALILILSASLVILIILFKRRALWWILYVPILQGLALGQLDILFLGLLRIGTPLTIALISLKPQLLPLAIPILITNRKMWKRTAIYIGLLYGFPTLIVPGWIGQWLHQLDDGRLSGLSGSSFWTVPVIGFVILLILAMLRRISIKTIATSFNPTLRAYDYSLLAGSHWLLVPISWLAWGAMRITSSAWPMAFCGLFAHDTKQAAA